MNEHLRLPAKRSAVCADRSTRAWISAGVALAMLLTLSGCPLKDDYFIDSERGSGGGGDTGGEKSRGSGGNESATGGQRSCEAGCAPGRACISGACESGWVPMAAPPSSFVARERAAAASSNGKLFLFGGRDAQGEVLDSAAIYDLATDSWAQVSTDSATPSPRELATAVWLGSQVLVFGGRNASATEYYISGALYDTVSDRWSAISDAVIPRAAPVGTAVPGKAIFWGGLSTGAVAASGAVRYDLTSDSWQPATTLNGPNPLLGAAWGLTADSLFIYGGLDTNNMRKDAAYRYDLLKDAWTTLPHGPKGRSSAFGVSDGSSFYVWGGRDGNMVLRDGSIYGAAWMPMGPGGAPSARCALPRQQGWAFSLGSGDVAIFGGQNQNGEFLSDGSRYQTSSGWSPIPSWPSGEDHNFGSSALVAGEVVVWGGLDGTSPTTTGERWAP